MGWGVQFPVFTFFFFFFPNSLVTMTEEEELSRNVCELGSVLLFGEQNASWIPKLRLSWLNKTTPLSQVIKTGDTAFFLG